jgi:hypothetical protein
MAGTASADSALRRYTRSVFDAFADMPHRGSGTHYEARAARILSRLAGESTGARVDSQPFAVDLSSGAWNVALHGAILCSVLGLAWLGGLGLSAVWGPGSTPASLGPLGTVPFPVALTCLAASLVLLVSRWMAGSSGWGVFSFFLPNADSSNVIVSSFARGDDSASIRLPCEKQWEARFRASGRKRLVILSAHYDSARCLPPMSAPGPLQRALLAALKNSISALPTFFYFVLIACFGLSSALAFLDPAGGLMSGALGWVAAILTLAGFIVAAVEAIVAGLSVDKPFEQGFNDDLSGVVAALGAFSRLCPAPDNEGLAETAVMVLLAGSEENGLRGSTVFSRTVLRAAVECFGIEGVFLVNADSVSGGRLKAAPSEHNFTGGLRGGDPAFGRAATAFLRGRRLGQAEADEHFTRDEQALCLLPRDDGFGYAIDYDGSALAACTDMTAFCAPPGFNGKLRAFSVVSVAEGSGPIAQPRDYHQPSDTWATLFLASEPQNYATVLALSLALSDLAAEIDRGGFDGP